MASILGQLDIIKTLTSFRCPGFIAVVLNQGEVKNVAKNN
jgi:hypothetical protein